MTGSSGLIGSVTCSILEDKGFEVITMDTRVQPKTKEKPEFGNILDINELAKATRNVDGIIHLAAISRVEEAEKNPELCRLTNVIGLTNLIFVAKKQAKTPWIIFASSRETYGEPIFLPVPEEHPLKPINIYGHCKKIAENLLLDKTNKDLTAVIFRFSNVYGSLLDYPTRVIPAFLKGTLTQTTLRVDSPSYVFDFTHVNDVASSTLTVVEALASKKLEGSRVFNLSPGEGTSLAQLIEILEDITGKNILTMKGEQRSYDVSRYIGDSTKIQRELGCHCRITLKEGLKLLYQEYLDSWGSLN